MKRLTIISPFHNELIELFKIFKILRASISTNLKTIFPQNLSNRF